MVIPITPAAPRDLSGLSKRERDAVIALFGPVDMPGYTPGVMDDGWDRRQWLSSQPGIPGVPSYLQQQGPPTPFAMHVYTHHVDLALRKGTEIDLPGYNHDIARGTDRERIEWLWHQPGFSRHIPGPASPFALHVNNPSTWTEDGLDERSIRFRQIVGGFVARTPFVGPQLPEPKPKRPFEDN